MIRQERGRVEALPSYWTGGDAARNSFPGSARATLVSKEKVRLFDDPQHWRERADEARTTAALIRDAETKATMLRIANDYERLARRTEERLARGSAK
jgi:hypothetical protein